MPRKTSSRDRFDDIEFAPDRVGAHRAENPRMRGWVVFVWALIAAVVLTAIGIFGSLVISERIVLFPEPEPTVEPLPETTPVIDPSYDVLVLNATPESGLATVVKDEIVAAGVGWTNETVFASQAGSTDFEATTVYYAYDEDEAAALGLADLLGGAEVAQSDVYLQTEQAEDGSQVRQLTVVIGADRLAPAEETTP